MPMTDEEYTYYAELLVRHKLLIWQLSLWYARGDRDRGFDLMQEVVLTIWRYLPSLRPDATPRQERQWIRYVTRRVHHNSKRGHKADLVQLRAEMESDGIDDTASTRDTIAELAAHLKPDDRRLLDLYLDGYTLAEAATLLGISHSAARQRMRRIRLRLQQIYQKLYNQ